MHAISENLSPVARPTTPLDKSSSSRRGSFHGSLFIPDRTSSRSRGATPAETVQDRKKASRNPPKLLYAYMICGLSREPDLWTWLPPSDRDNHPTPKIGTSNTILPQILGSVPPQDKNENVAKTLSDAVRACFPNDIDIRIQDCAPSSSCHTYILQRQSSTIYGVALVVWVLLDQKRTQGVRVSLGKKYLAQQKEDDLLWMPYCLTYLSPYPVFDLMGDFLRSTWNEWRNEPEEFNNRGVMQILSIPAPTPGNLIRLTVSLNTLSLHIPKDLSQLRNFSLWPLFQCLSVRHIVAVFESFLSPKCRIIFTSHHPAILSIATETLHFYRKEWTGLYVPVVYVRQAQELMNQPAPYILGISKKSRSYFSAPADALLIDLDYDRIFTSLPPASLSKRQRRKCEAVLTHAFAGIVSRREVPQHLRSAFNPSLSLSVQHIGENNDGALQVVKDPTWWDQDAMKTAMRYLCSRIDRNTKLLSFGRQNGVDKKTKLPTRDFVAILHERTRLAQDVAVAWQECFSLKHQKDAEHLRFGRSEILMRSKLNGLQHGFAELAACTEEMVEEVTLLQTLVKHKERENRTLETQSRQALERESELSQKVTDIERKYNEVYQTLHCQQELLREVELGRERDQKMLFELQQTEHNAWLERDEAERAVVHLSSIISAQVSYIERVLASSSPLPSQSRSQGEPELRNSVSISRSQNTRSPTVFSRSSDSRSLTTSPQLTDGLFSKRISMLSPQPSMASKRHTFDFSGLSTSDPKSNDLMSKRFSQLVHVSSEEATDLDKVSIVTEVIRKINEQCKTVIEDLAIRRNSTSIRVTPSSEKFGTQEDSDSESTDTSTESIVHDSYVRRHHISIESPADTPEPEPESSTAQLSAEMTKRVDLLSTVKLISRGIT